MTFQKGEVLLMVAYLYTDLTTVKVRPTKVRREKGP